MLYPFSARTKEFNVVLEIKILSGSIVNLQKQIDELKEQITKQSGFRESPKQFFSGDQLIMLIHIYSTNDFTKYLNANWPEHTQHLQVFRNLGLIRRTGIGTELEMTSKGHKFVEKLLYTKLD